MHLPAQGKLSTHIKQAGPRSVRLVCTAVVCIGLGAGLAINNAFGTGTLNFTSNNTFGGNLPSLGDADAAELPFRDELKLGQVLVRDIKAQPQFNPSIELTEAIHALGFQLLKAGGLIESPFEFFVLTDPVLNAFAMPGGFIGVHTGLIATARNPDELASVLAHEIAHVAQRHIARRFTQAKQASMVSTAAMIAALLIAGSNPQAASGIAAASAGYSLDKQLGFSRDAEREADRLGLQTLRDAGFKPQAMVVFFGRLQQSTRFIQNNAPAYLRTHPLTTERMADIQNRVGYLSGSVTGPMANSPNANAVATQNPEFELLRMLALVQSDNTRELRQKRLQWLDGVEAKAQFNDEATRLYGKSLVHAQLQNPAEARKALNSIAPEHPAWNTVLVANQQLRVQASAPRFALGRGAFDATQLPPKRTLAELSPAEQTLFAQVQDHRKRFAHSTAAQAESMRLLLGMGLYVEADVALRDLLLATQDPLQANAKFKSNAQAVNAKTANVKTANIQTHRADFLEWRAQAAAGLNQPAEQHLYLAQAQAARGYYLPAIELAQLAKTFATNRYTLLAELDALIRSLQQMANEEQQWMRTFGG